MDGFFLFCFLNLFSGGRLRIFDVPSLACSNIQGLDKFCQHTAVCLTHFVKTLVELCRYVKVTYPHTYVDNADPRRGYAPTYVC